MRILGRLAIGFLMLAVAAVTPARASEHRIGIGYHYFQTVNNINSPGDVNDKGSSLVASYQYLPGGLIRFEGDLEVYPDGYGGSTGKAYSPQAYVLFGRGLYGGVGIGLNKSDTFVSGKKWSDPWYAARVGLDMLLLPKLHLDLNVNYRANAFNQLDNAKTDAMTFGASVRIGF